MSVRSFPQLVLRPLREFTTPGLAICCVVALFSTMPMFAQSKGDSTPAVLSSPSPAKFLYVEGGYELGINANTGALKYLRGVAPGVGVIDPSYHYTYFAGRDSQNNSPVIYAYQINQATGELTAVAGSPFPTDPSDLYLQAFTDARNEFVFLGEQDQYSNIHMSVFRIDPGTGALTQTDRVLVANESTTYAPGCIVTSQSGKYVYFGYDGNNAPNWISAFALDAANGTVSEVAGSPFSAPSIAMGLMPGMATVGNLLYTLNTDQTISGFAINPQTGALAQVSGSPFADPLVASMTIDTVHNLLFTSNSSGAFTCSQSSINSFGINLSSGKLTRIATSGTAGLSCPNPIVADPSGKFVYVGGLVMQAPNCEFDQCYGATSSFLVDPTTGKLTAVTKGLPYPGDPVDDNFVLTLGR